MFPSGFDADGRGHRVRNRVEALHVWLEDHAGRVSAASGLGEAIRYALRHWSGLLVFLDDGRIEMDTNTVERVIRPITITRKNALFAGNDGGARHWAIAMTLIQTAKLNGVEPMAYLTDVLEQIVSGRTKASALEALLPWNWKASRSSATTAAQAA
jgi:transposase